MTVSADTDGDFANITMEVEDTGIGIPESEIEKIFAMYYQVKSGTEQLCTLSARVLVLLSLNS